MIKQEYFSILERISIYKDRDFERKRFAGKKNRRHDFINNFA